ncbi:MAG: S46 family peptidase [Myxococcales bacterium]|nr:S46 family peptidase [Myxococcales bacterium]
MSTVSLFAAGLTHLRANLRSLLVAALVCVSLQLLAPPSHADEGMWMPAQLSQIAGQLTKAGLKLPTATLQDLKKGPLAAVINLNGCTASFVSADGLIVTNHHCAVGAIQRNSTASANLLEAGFTAKKRTDERWAGPGSRVLITLKETEVTGQFRAALKGVKDDLAAFEKVDGLKKQLIKTCEADGQSRCRVATYDGGARYVLVHQLDLRDVRLVHAPPRAIGVYGGDIDNWMWPRHTGDWALFRAYVGKDGRPADHANTNVPFRPKKWLTVSAQGVKAGSYVMVAGYPGRTYRYRLPLELKDAEAVSYPRTIKILADLVTILETQQKASASARVKLTSLRAGLANYLKYSRGLLDGFRKSQATAAETKRYAALKGWIAQDAIRRATYERPLQRLEARLTEMQGRRRRAEVLRWMLRLPVLVRTAATLDWLATEREKPDEKRDRGYQKRDWARLQGRLEQRARTYVKAADQEMMVYLLRQANGLPGSARIAVVDALLKKFGAKGSKTEAGISRAVAHLYSKQTLAKDKTRKKLFAAGRKKFKSRDPMLKFVMALQPLRRKIDEQHKRDAGFLAAHRPAYLAALRDRFGEMYPDANSTLRVTFGNVKGYSPRESIQYTPQTSLAGVLEKHTGKAPFDVPPSAREAIRRTHAKIRQGRATSPWIDKGLGSVGVNFLSTCDTTGGNSGSPTLDAQGRLVGLLFDGNYEAMASDWVFDRVKTRSIHVDIRYLLWALHEVLGGQHLLNEMGHGTPKRSL